MVKDTLSAAEARRLALGAQGLAGRSSALAARPAIPTGRQSVGSQEPDTATPAPGTRAIKRELSRMGVLQIDSVNVFARSHYLPVFSRLGAYDTAALDSLVLGRPRGRTAPEFIEYLGHEATFLPKGDWPLWEFRRKRLRAKYGTGDEWYAQNPDTIAWVRAELADRGPLTAGQVRRDADKRTRGTWWDWDDVKLALEMMWRFGEVVVAGRTGFERRYALAERALPSRLLEKQIPAVEAVTELVRRAARAYGVATVADLADYYRLRSRPAVERAVDALVDSGELTPVTVRGWVNGAGRSIPAYRWTAAPIPRVTERATVLTPFDPAVWFRDRALRMFGFHYRIEIYTPAAKRRFGYYSLPVLIADRISARVDLKADRKNSTLLVQSAWWEDHADPASAAPYLAQAVRDAAAGQGLETVSVSTWGDAAEHLAGELRSGRHMGPGGR